MIVKVADVSSREQKDFIDTVIGGDILVYAIEYIRDNYTPDDIFDDNVLIDWALNNGYTIEDLYV